MSDSEDITVRSDAPDDLGGMFVHIAGLIPWKVIIFVFLGFIVLNTSIFIEKVLSHWSGTVEGRCPTEKGLLIQGLLLTLGVVVVSICAGGDLI
jgi:hypothetical protein